MSIKNQLSIMKLSKFSTLCDVAQSDFAIKDERLFYKDREIASSVKILLESSEEVLFLFSVTATEPELPFKMVVFLNYHRCAFYPCAEYQKNGETLSFTTPEGKKYVFTRYRYYGNIRSSKIIGGFRRS